MRKERRAVIRSDTARKLLLLLPATGNLQWPTDLQRNFRGEWETFLRKPSESLAPRTGLWLMDGVLRCFSRDLSYFLSNDAIATTRSPYRRIILQFSLRVTNAYFATGTSYRVKPHPTGDNTESTEETNIFQNKISSALIIVLRIFIFSKNFLTHIITIFIINSFLWKAIYNVSH